MSKIIISNLNLVRLPHYNNILKSRNNKVDIMPKTIWFVTGGIDIFISWFIHPSKLIMNKHTTFTKTDNLENLVLIVKDENKTWRNNGVINVYTFSHEDSEGIEFYTARQYVHLTKEGREEQLFVSD